MSERVVKRMEELFQKHRDEGGSWKRQEYVLVAKCLTGRHVLRAGYGVAGVGRMWGPVRPSDLDDELWDELPVVQCVSFSIPDPCPPGPHDPKELILANAEETVKAARAERAREQN